jgi:hypothetical protein
MRVAAGKIYVGLSRFGKGVYAQHRFQCDDTISEIFGEIINDPDYESCYCMELDEQRKLEPAYPFKYLNHSCNPNCEIVGYDDDPEAQDRLWLAAIRTIQPGDELMIDYGWPAEAAIPCHCGSEVCRGWVVDVDDLAKLAALDRLTRRR